MAGESYASFDQVKARLDEIVDAVGSSEMPLDEALSLYEEAVGLGLRASELLEENIEARDAEDGAEDGADATGREAGAGAAGETEAAGPDAEASATAAAQA
ncbi:exodeoxyribonuclease VII small subunit [Gordonibacter pamelaeae]|uniref:exodeoxyribonuclease VII small subunit n=1 Tax=Gordonibacter pamelaeae TaxID=471189 RepID=UPI00242C9EAE|nr:exodeoxyribonuclease VII small subunit [Gordonibacter pamelaeae]